MTKKEIVTYTEAAKVFIKCALGTYKARSDVKVCTCKHKCGKGGMIKIVRYRYEMERDIKKEKQRLRKEELSS